MLTRCAFLLGAAKKGYRQKKLSRMYETLVADGWAEREIVEFPNGVSELLLEYALNHCMEQNGVEHNNCVEHKNAKIFLFFCVLSQDCIKDDCIVLGTDEIRKSVIAHYVAVAEKVGAEMQVVYDWDG
ncbi:MAG: hypothetical protein II811_04565, partial [Spirochaetaceae bacterium]|nr:hypothetical protein [Spirochaetaceae bacterium]